MHRQCSSTFVFDNDFPALLPESAAPTTDGGGLLVSEPATGCCRVICFSPRHDVTLAEMPPSQIRPVVDRLRKRYGRDPVVWPEEMKSGAADSEEPSR